VHVGRVERRAAAAVLGEPMQDVVGDAVALVLAEEDLARQALALGVVRQQVAQQQRRALHVAARLLEELEQQRIRLRPHQPHRGGTLARAARRSPPLHRWFTRR
jgi:hypothetical protein